jgi:hypothetical protein
MYGNCGEFKAKQIETKPFDQTPFSVQSVGFRKRKKRVSKWRNQRSHCHQKKRGGDQFMDLLVRVHKRSADIRITHGEDVVNASQFIKQMHESGSKVEVYQIQEQDIKEIERKVKDKNLKAIPGTIKIHQLTTEQSELVVYVMINFAMVTNCALSISRVVQKNQNKVVQRNQNKILHKTHIRTAEENQARMGDIRQRNI